MKQLFFFFALLFSFFAKAQNMDTVIVRNLTLTAGDWAYLVGSYNNTSDSAAIMTYHKIRSKVRSTPNVAWTTNITIDSLPGRTVVAFYQIAKTSGAGEIAGRYTAITNAIAGKTNLSYWIGFIDAAVQSDYTQKRSRGKNLLLD